MSLHGEWQTWFDFKNKAQTICAVNPIVWTTLVFPQKMMIVFFYWSTSYAFLWNILSWVLVLKIWIRISWYTRYSLKHSCMVSNDMLLLDNFATLVNSELLKLLSSARVFVRLGSFKDSKLNQLIVKCCHALIIQHKHKLFVLCSWNQNTTPFLQVLVFTMFCLSPPIPPSN